MQAQKLDEQLMRQAAVLHQLSNRLTELQGRFEAEVLTNVEKSNQIDELTSQLRSISNRLDKRDQIIEPDNDENESDATQSPSRQEELLGDCLGRHVHTRAFTQWATDVDFQGSKRASFTTGDGEGSSAWIARLASMNVSIANLWDGKDNWTLSDKLERLVRDHGRTFLLDSHNGCGKYNYNACTSMICNHCGAKLVIPHPGLPSKGGAKADANVITNVNEKLVNFLWTEKAIAEHKPNLLGNVVCTIERHFPGSVVAHPPTCSTASCGPGIGMRCFQS